MENHPESPDLDGGTILKNSLVDDGAVNPGTVERTKVLNRGEARAVVGDVETCVVTRNRHVVEKDAVRGIASDSDDGIIELEGHPSLGTLNDA